jgi:predicted patatin/cPLA2 family phospholipase
MSLPFKKLALGGGGAKGILHIGALQELSKHQKLDFPDGVYGCSIGSVIATVVAFGLPIDSKLIELTKEHLSMSKVTPKLTFNDITNSLSHKGVFGMELFEEKICIVFEELGIDIRSKKIRDAKMPLYIIASNISKGIPTIFTKDVPILSALKCSCCIPGVFKPQELYGQIYIDGDIFTPCIGITQSDALEISLKTNIIEKITPENIGSMSPLIYMRQIVNMSVINFIELQKTELTLEIIYPELMSDSELSEFDTDDILKVANESMRNFLVTKSFLKELS